MVRISAYTVHPKTLAKIAAEQQWEKEICFKPQVEGIFFITEKMELGTKDYDRTRTDVYYKESMRIHNLVYCDKKNHSGLVHIKAKGGEND